MSATKAAQSILRKCGFSDGGMLPLPRSTGGTFGDLDVRPLTQELRSADLMITFGGDGRFCTWQSWRH